jgi:hypothetical protein
MLKINLRKCWVYSIDEGPQPAVFHQFGCMEKEGREGMIISSAIVEYKDGQVAQVAPERVQFVNED